MNTRHDPLSDRAADWVARVGTSDNPASGQLALEGWAICEAMRRSCGGIPAQLIEAVESRLGSLPTHSIPALVESATSRWNGLMNDLDAEEENLEHVRRETRDVFFSVLDALILAEESGEPAAAQAAQRLFNAVVADLYALEPMADVAAELQPRAQGQFRLSDLLCAGVAGLFDGQVHQREPAAVALSEGVEVDDAVEEFIPLGVWLQRGPRGTLTLANLAKHLAEIPAWYVKWSTQQLRLAVNAATRELRVQVIDANGATGPSLAMDGWQVRTGERVKPAVIKGGAAAIPLSDKLDPAKFAFQVRQPAASGEWVDVFARVGA